MLRRRFLHWSLGGAVSAATNVSFAAVAEPANVRIVVPAAAGGATDALTRIVAQYLAVEWKRPIIVDNRAGAGGVIGSAQVAKATPDGSVLLMGALSHAVNPAMMDNVPYDALGDFEPIAKLVNFGSVLVVNPAVPVSNLKEFIAYAKTNPGKLAWGLGAIGTSQQLAGVLLQRQAGFKVLEVPYKGGGPAMTDLLGNQVNFMIESIPTAIPFIKSGKIKALAVTGSVRSTGLPDVPTIAEAGVPGFNVESWFALLGPKGIQPALVQEIADKLNVIMARTEVRERLVALGATPDFRGPTETREFIKDEIGRWTPIIKEAGIRAN